MILNIPVGWQVIGRNKSKLQMNRPPHGIKEVVVFLDGIGMKGIKPLKRECAELMFYGLGIKL
jgi:hypothetical protein